MNMLNKDCELDIHSSTRDIGGSYYSESTRSGLRRSRERTRAHVPGCLGSLLDEETTMSLGGTLAWQSTFGYCHLRTWMNGITTEVWAKD
ncbi:hypothetical protein FRC12_022027 [Ceratobasidium sp. 428]|nr:hypothetical protein FRC12_022027 [Ceratobasidium sp. 428]